MKPTRRPARARDVDEAGVREVQPADAGRHRDDVAGLHLRRSRGDARLGDVDQLEPGEARLGRADGAGERRVVGEVRVRRAVRGHEGDALVERHAAGLGGDVADDAARVVVGDPLREVVQARGSSRPSRRRGSASRGSRRGSASGVVSPIAIVCATARTFSTKSTQSKLREVREERLAARRVQHAGDVGAARGAARRPTARSRRTAARRCPARARRHVIALYAAAVRRARGAASESAGGDGDHGDGRRRAGGRARRGHVGGRGRTRRRRTRRRRRRRRGRPRAGAWASEEALCAGSYVPSNAPLRGVVRRPAVSLVERRHAARTRSAARRRRSYSARGISTVAEAREVRRRHLRVEQHEPARAQPRHEVHERHLGRVAAQADHALAEERPAERDAVEPAREARRRRGTRRCGRTRRGAAPCTPRRSRPRSTSSRGLAQARRTPG